VKLPIPEKIIVTVKGWQLVVRIGAWLRRREKAPPTDPELKGGSVPLIVPWPKSPAVPEMDEDPDGGWIDETRP